jgi:hypothetical protein
MRNGKKKNGKLARNPKLCIFSFKFMFFPGLEGCFFWIVEKRQFVLLLVFFGLHL